jgi:hypothetical protein
MMGQGERRAKAVLAAAVAYIDFLSEKDKSLAEIEPLVQAVTKYKEVMAVQLPADPTAFFCPHCGAEKPAYGWNYNAGDTGPFAVAYLTCFCGACKEILSVAVTSFIPGEKLAQTLMQQFKGLLKTPV